MKEILEEMKIQTKLMEDTFKEMQFQTKLLENLFHAKDSKQNGSQHIQKSMSMLMSSISSMPGMKTPQAQKIIKDAMSIIPK